MLRGKIAVKKIFFKKNKKILKKGLQFKKKYAIIGKA